MKFQAWLLLHKLYSNNCFCLFFLETLMFVFCNVKQFYSIQLTGCEVFAMIINRAGQTVALRIWASKTHARVKVYITTIKYKFMFNRLVLFMIYFKKLHFKYTRSRKITEVKQGVAELVLGSVTARQSLSGSQIC